MSTPFSQSAVRPSPSSLVSRAGIPVAEVVSALSFALDLTEDAVPGHALRSCLLGMRLAESLGVGDLERSDLFYALLLKDVGCSNNAARLCQVIGSDERVLKSAVKFEDWTRPTLSGMRMMWNHLSPSSTRAARVARLVKFGLQQDEVNREMIQLRCDRGAHIVLRIGLSNESSMAVRHLDEHWDGSGFPNRLKGEQIPLLSRILLVAQHLDVFATRRGTQVALDELAERSGRWFDPTLVQAVQKLHAGGLLWTHMDTEQDTRAAVLDLEPGQRPMASEDQLDQICEAFADVVDVKSSFTGLHSRGVTAAALLMADALHLAPDRRRLIARASLLHDLGKLRVPNSILDKKGALTPEEFGIVREHPLLTQQILSRIERFSEVASIAGQHHEKLDGSGYPHGLRAEQLPLEARLIAVADVYGALSEQRPYRKSLPFSEICQIMQREVGPKLDPQCYAALLSGLKNNVAAIPA